MKKGTQINFSVQKKNLRVFGPKIYHCVLLKKPKYNLQNGVEVNNDQKESFFITERNLESIDPNEDVDVTVS